jgi:hypothetical protein
MLSSSKTWRNKVMVCRMGKREGTPGYVHYIPNVLSETLGNVYGNIFDSSRRRACVGEGSDAEDEQVASRPQQ